MQNGTKNGSQYPQGYEHVSLPRIIRFKSVSRHPSFRIKERGKFYKRLETGFGTLLMTQLQWCQDSSLFRPYSRRHFKKNVCLYQGVK